MLYPFFSPHPYLVVCGDWTWNIFHLRTLLDWLTDLCLTRYHEENKNFTNDFKFGPLFMRLCYELGLEEMAAATLTDKVL